MGLPHSQLVRVPRLNSDNHSDPCCLTRRMLPNFQRLLIDAHRSDVNRSLLI